MTGLKNVSWKALPLQTPRATSSLFGSGLLSGRTFAVLNFLIIDTVAVHVT